METPVANLMAACESHHLKGLIFAYNDFIRLAVNQSGEDIAFFRPCKLGINKWVHFVLNAKNCASSTRVKKLDHGIVTIREKAVLIFPDVLMQLMNLRVDAFFYEFIHFSTTYSVFR